MSSKNATTNQGRRTPLTLNPQPKPVQQQQGKRPSVSSNEMQQAETRSKQQPIVHQQQLKQPLQPKKEEDKKDGAGTTSAVASAAGPVPAEKSASKQQPNANLKNGMNNGTEPKSTPVNINGNKVAVAETKKEMETRNKSTTPVAEEQQPAKNGADAAAKAAFANSSGNSGLRKQQPQQVKLQIQHAQQQKQTQEEQLKKGVEAQQMKTQSETFSVVKVVEDQEQSSAKTTPKKEEKQQEQQKPIEALNKSVTTVAVVKAATPPSTSKKISPVKKFYMTTVIDVEDMDASPQKSERMKIAVPLMSESPKATSTPGKVAKKGVINPSTPVENQLFSAISGRRSIRPLTDWTPSKFDNNPQFGGSYRRLKTDLDVSDANTSLNVTVGSEPGNNTSWFSFRSRKRDRTPTNVENIQEDILSPKRARFGGLFSIMASPFTALRSRFARASIKAYPENDIMEEQEDHNVSMGEEVSIIDIEEEIIPASEIKKNSPLKKEEHIKDDNETKTKKTLEDKNEQVDSTLNASNDSAKKERCNMM